jgi:hypothetical protein
MLLELLAAAAAADLPPPCPDCLPVPAVAGPPAPAAPPVSAMRGRGRVAVGLATGISRLSRGAGGIWQRREGWLTLRGGASGVTVGGEWQRRRATRDITLQVRGDTGWQGGSAYLALLATPHADFAERRGLRTGGELALSPRFDLTADARLSNYAAGTSLALAAGPRLWLDRRRIAARVKAIAQRDELRRVRLGWAADAGIDATAQLHLTAAAARYPESDAGTTRRVALGAVGAAWRASETLTLRGAIEREDRARSYRRDSATISLAVAF